MSPSFVIVDHGCGIAPADLVRVAAALQVQLVRDFSQAPPLGWGLGGTVRASTQDMPARDTEWVLGLFTDPDQPGALGYHDVSLTGTPLSKIFPLLDAQDNQPWSITASHEMLETLADPLLAMCFQGPDGRVWAGEVCDAVEADFYEIDGVAVSNWVRPAYFQPLKQRPAGGYDFMGTVSEPLELRPGGYNQWLDGSSWTLVDRGQRAARQLAAAARSRTIRRRYPGPR